MSPESWRRSREIRQQKADLGSARLEGAPDSIILMSAQRQKRGSAVVQSSDFSNRLISLQSVVTMTPPAHAGGPAGDSKDWPEGFTGNCPVDSRRGRRMSSAAVSREHARGHGKRFHGQVFLVR
jgi:hypothetical protein